MRQIYLDYNATTPIAPSVLEAMVPFLQTHYGNPSSSHVLGRAAGAAVDDARGKVAALVGCDPEEIIFTSCGTESNNLAIKGIMQRGSANARGHLIISAIEHASVANPARFLERVGYELTVVPCNRDGVISPFDVQKAFRPDTRLVSIMHANNEIGTVQPVDEIGEICRQNNILFHTDAAQSVGKVSAFVDDLNVDLMTIAGHKLYAPKGVGALYVRKGVGLEPLLHGASQEWGMRGGTLNTAYIVGLGQAAKIVLSQMEEAVERISELRDRLENLLRRGIPDLTIHACDVIRLPNTSSMAFPNVSAFELLKRAPELCASLGTACHGQCGPISATLSALGSSENEAAGTVRLSLGWNTTSEEVELAASSLLQAWELLAQK